MFAGFFIFKKTPKLTFKHKEKVSDSVSKCPVKSYSPEMTELIVFQDVHEMNILFRPSCNANFVTLND